MMLQGSSLRSAYSERKTVVVSMFLGCALAALLSLPLTRYQEELATTMAFASSAMIQPRLMQPTLAQYQMQQMRQMQQMQQMQRATFAQHQMQPTFAQQQLQRQQMQQMRDHSAAHGELGMVTSSVGRRTLIAGGGFALAGASLKDRAASAAYGDGANIFASRPTNPSGFSAYSGDGFSLLIPAKWNPSRERDFDGVVLRYEDNADRSNDLMVIKQQTTKSKMEDYGSPEQFLAKYQYLLGEQEYSGKSISEGGFAPDRVAAASVLDLEADTDRNGRSRYKYHILCRTADGDEGGKHQLISATVSNGNLYLLKIQVGDKRWFKGTKKDAEGSFISFLVGTA